MLNSIEIGDKININNSFDNKLYISVIPEDILDFWIRGSNLANFISDFYYCDHPDKMVQNTISTVLNELIENAIKFSDQKKHPVDIYTFNKNNEFIFQISNSISSESADSFPVLCHQLFDENLDELYVKRIENLYQSKSNTGIGLVLLKKDYKTDINFKFTTDKNNQKQIIVTVKINTD